MRDPTIRERQYPKNSAALRRELAVPELWTTHHIYYLLAAGGTTRMWSALGLLGARCSLSLIHIWPVRYVG